MRFNKNNDLENTTKIIALVCILLITSCNSNNDGYRHLKHNLFLNEKNELVMKLSNKSPIHPTLNKEWKDTIYRKSFYLSFDSLVNLNNIIDLDSYSIIVDDYCYKDKKHTYISRFYKAGQRMHIILKNEEAYDLIQNKVLYQKESLR